MSLKNLRLPSAEIQIPGGDSFTVRGLSTVELEDLYRNNRGAVVDIYGKYIGAEDEPDWAQMIPDVLRMAPGLVAQVIAIAANEPGQTDDGDLEIVSRFTPGIQLKALERIGAMTFSVETDGKNLLEIVAAFLQNLNPLLEVVSSKLGDLEVMKDAQQLKTGYGNSGDK